MSSERATARRVRQRLHSVVFHGYRRLFAVLLVADAGRVVRNLLAGTQPSLGPFDTLLHATAFSLLAYFLWFRCRTVFASEVGLELGYGTDVRLVPWKLVVSLREMPWMSLQPPWHPKLYQLDLVGGETIDFVGRRDVR